jgi:hypothetical protein
MFLFWKDLGGGQDNQGVLILIELTRSSVPKLDSELFSMCCYTDAYKSTRAADYGEVSSEINKCCRPTSSRHSRGPATRGELTRRDKRREVARRREALSSTARPTRLRGAPGKLLVRAREACWCKAGAQARDSAGERLRSIRDRGSIGAFSK